MREIGAITFASVYPLYVKKVTRKGRTEAELLEVIEWLTGFDSKTLTQLITEKVTFAAFFQQARLNPKAVLIKGKICGVQIEQITDPLTRKIRYLDKIVDELAKGKKMEKIKRE